MSSLLSSQRFQKPLRRPPHVVGTPRQPRDGDMGDAFQGLVPAPHDSEDDADCKLIPDIMSLAGPGGGSQACCPGKASRPDTCFMTHRYVKQEIAYLSRRIDEVGRYFVALETMLGSGAFGPVLDRALKELEGHLQHPEKLEDPEEVQSFIDAAIRLGIGPHRYRPLQDRYDWLCHGRYQEELRLQLLEANLAEDSMQLQQLIDDSLRAGISAKELHPARVRLRALHEQEFNEAMLAAAVAGDVRSVREKLRTGGNCDAQQSSTGHSLWHIAASRGDAGLAEIARSSSTQVDLFDRSGWTPLMLASARHDIVLVQDLLAAQADLTATSSRGEVIVECQDATELEAVERELNDNRRLMNYWEDSGRCLDFGDQLAAGEELLLPTFQKVGGRTVLHTALLRPGLESCRISVLNEVLAQPNAPVNALDDLGYSPLWYAAHGGFVGSSSALLRAGARVSLGNCSCIQAAADSFAKAAAQGEPAEVWLHICRLFSRHGAGDFAEEMLAAEAAIAAAGAYPALEHTPDFEEALEASGAAEALDAGCADTSHVFEMRYNSCLLIHRPPSQLTSAEDAASFASAAQPDFESVAFTLAKMFGGYADVPRKVSASHMTRLSRLQRRYAGDFCYAPGAPIDWAAVVGGLEATLVLPSVSDVYKALAELEESWPFKIRGVWDHLLRRDSSRPSWQDGRSRERAEAEAGDSEQQGSSCEYPAAQKVAVAGVEAAGRRALRVLAEERKTAWMVAKVSVTAVAEKVLQSFRGTQVALEKTPAAGAADVIEKAQAAMVSTPPLSSPWRAEESRPGTTSVVADGAEKQGDRGSHALKAFSEERVAATAVAVASISAAAQSALETLAAEGSQLRAESTASSRQLPEVEDRAAAVAVAAASIAASAEKALATLAAEGSREVSLDPRTSRQLRESQEASRGEQDLAEVQVMIECSGAICLLRLTAAGVHEVVQATVQRGRWVLEDLATVMRAAVEGICSPLEAEEEVLETLEAAARRLGQQQLTQVLAVPLHDTSNSWTCTALGLAAHCGLTGVLKLLVDAGAPVSQPRLPPSLVPRGDCSPLSLAVAGHHFQCIELLIASGADPFDDRVDTILLDMLSDDWLEARWFQEKVLRMLEVARSQSQVDAQTLARLGASFDGSPDQVAQLRRLLTYSADPNVKVCPVTFDPTSEAAIPLLSSAAAAGHKELVSMLLEHGATVDSHAVSLAKGTAAEDVLRRRAQSQLQCAANALDLATMVQLVEAGVHPESLLRDRWTLLTFAARLAAEWDPGATLVQVLLNASAKPDTRDAEGRFPLMCAAEADRADLVALLLRRGADVHAIGNSGRSVAAMSALRGSLAVLEVLLDGGANCRDQDPNGDDVAMLALKAGHADCVEAIRQRGHLPHRDLALWELFGAIRRGESDYMERLLDILVTIYPNLANSGEDGAIGEATSTAPTLLIESVRQRCPRMVSALLQAGARLYPQYFPPDATPDAMEVTRCETAWSVATGEVPCPEVAALLRQAFPQELLLMARDGTTDEMRNIQQEEASGLMAEEEDFEVTDESGNGALDYAILREDVAMETWLCSRGARSPNGRAKLHRQAVRKAHGNSLGNSLMSVGLSEMSHP